jgi:hypothetical protein
MRCETGDHLLYVHLLRASPLPPCCNASMQAGVCCGSAAVWLVGRRWVDGGIHNVTYLIFAPPGGRELNSYATAQNRTQPHTTVSLGLYAPHYMYESMNRACKVKVKSRYDRAESSAYCLFEVDRLASNGTSDCFGRWRLLSRSEHR